MIMKLLFLCTSALFMGLPHTASGSTSTTDLPTTAHPIASTTDYASNPKWQHIIQIVRNSNIADCIDTQKYVCTHYTGNVTRYDGETVCRLLKIYPQCIDKCDQPLKDVINEGLKEFSCGGCGLLQGSLLALILAAFLYYFV